MKQLLILVSLFVAAAGIWLGVMENLLRHDGYPGRSVIAACIAIQGVATLLFVLLNGGRVFRILILSGALAILWLGGLAVANILRAPHFEGFVLLIGLALIAQSALTLATLFQARYRMAA